MAASTGGGPARRPDAADRSSEPRQPRPAVGRPGTARANQVSPASRARASTLVDDVRDAWTHPMVRRGFWGMCLIGAGSLTPAFLPPDAPILRVLRLGFLERGPGRVVATLLVMLGVAVLLDAWLRMRPAPGRRNVPGIAWLIWSVPVLLAPPLFSRDAYSYAAQGLVVARGMDPYLAGPIAVPGPFADQVDPMWLYTPAPYGPVALQMQRFIVWLTGGNAYAAAVGMRLPALLSVAVLAWALPKLATRVGVSPHQARWLGVLNPMVMMHLVGGAHQDAMMIALVVIGLLLATRGHLVTSSIAIAGGAGFKQTAVIALIGVAALAVRARSQRSTGRGLVTYRRYLVSCAVSGAVALAAFEVLTRLTGLGWGWVPNMQVPTLLRSLLSPPTLIGSIAEGIMYLLGMPKAWTQVPVPAMRTLGVVLTVLAWAWLTLRVAPRRPMTAVAGAFLALCLGGPVIHPWYMLWGGVLLGATRLSRRSVQAVVWVTAFFCSYSAIDVAFSNGVWALGLTAVAWTVWKFRGPADHVVDWHQTAGLPPAGGDQVTRGRPDGDRDPDMAGLPSGR